jgi:ribosomal protein L7/L12
MTDAVGFAKIVTFVTNLAKRTLSTDELDMLYHTAKGTVTTQDVHTVNELLRYMQSGQKICAIKEYRTLTNADFKTSKDAVERYWTASLFNNTPAEFR